MNTTQMPGLGDIYASRPDRIEQRERHELKVEKRYHNVRHDSEMLAEAISEGAGHKPDLIDLLRHRYFDDIEQRVGAMVIESIRAYLWDAAERQIDDAA